VLLIDGYVLVNKARDIHRGVSPPSPPVARIVGFVTPKQAATRREQSSPDNSIRGPHYHSPRP
jgi:hypothetical protein